MQDHAGGVDDTPQPGCDRGAKSCGDVHRSLAFVDVSAGTLRCHLDAKRVHDPRMPELLDERRVGGLVHQPTYGGQG